MIVVLIKNILTKLVQIRTKKSTGKHDKRFGIKKHIEKTT